MLRSLVSSPIVSAADPARPLRVVPGSRLRSPDAADSWSIVFAGDFRSQVAAVQAQVYGVADGYLSGVAEDVAGGVGSDGIPAFQDA